MRLLLLSGLIFCLLPGCKHDADAPPMCYAGTVVGGTCVDGVLIAVDPVYPIGAPAHVWQADHHVLVGNAVAAVNLNTPANGGAADTVGHRLYFTYVNDPSRQQQSFCFALDRVAEPIPHLVLSNVSATPCGAL